MPGNWLPVGLALLENPERRFIQVASGGTHRDGMALALAGALEETHAILPDRVGMVPLPADHVGRFDEGPLQVVVGLLDHAAVVDLAAAGAHAGDCNVGARDVFEG